MSLLSPAVGVTALEFTRKKIRKKEQKKKKYHRSPGHVWVEMAEYRIDGER